MRNQISGPRWHPARARGPRTHPNRNAQTERRKDDRLTRRRRPPVGTGSVFGRLFADLTIAPRGTRVPSCISQITTAAQKGNTTGRVRAMSGPIMDSSAVALDGANMLFRPSIFTITAKQNKLTTMTIAHAIRGRKSRANPANSAIPTDGPMRAADTRLPEPFGHPRLPQRAVAIGTPPAAHTTAATCEDSGETSAAPALVPGGHAPDEWAIGTSKRFDEPVILRPFRLPQSSTTRHQNTEHPDVTQMRQFRNHADRCQTPSGRRGQWRLS